MGALGAPREGVGWSGALRWPLTVLPTASPRTAVHAADAHPPLPQGSLLPRAGHRRALFRGPAGTTERLLWLVSGDAIGGLGWVGRGRQGRVGPVCWAGRGAGGPGMEVRLENPGSRRAGTEPMPLWAGNLGHPQLLIVGGGWTDHLGTDASETGWEVGGAPLSELVTPPAVTWG